MQLAIETMLSLSEMYHDTFYKSKEIQFLMQAIDKKKSDTQTRHAYILFVKCMHTFLAITCKSIIFVSNDTNYCAFSIVHIIIIL